MERGGEEWTHLRGTVNHPPDASNIYELWWYPTSSDVDLSDDGDRSVMWLSDLENNFQYLANGVWKLEDGGESWNRSTQFTGHYSVDIDPNDSGRMYASGRVLNRISVTVDPEDPGRIQASHFGSGVWSSPRP